MFEFQTLDALQNSMNVAQRRHELLTHNLANLYVNGAERRDIDFERALEAGRGDLDLFEFQEGTPDLTRETSEMARTDSYYLASAKFANLYLANLRASFRGR